MKHLINFAKSLTLIAFFAGATLFVGCNAADLAGPDDAPQSQNECAECSNGRNL